MPVWTTRFLGVLSIKNPIFASLQIAKIKAPGEDNIVIETI